MRRLSIFATSLICVFWLASGALGQTAYVLTDLGNLGLDTSYASGINNLGQVVGYASAKDSRSEHTFLYSGGRTIELRCPGGLSTRALAINLLGQVTGSCDEDAGTAHPFLYTPGIGIQLIDSGSNAHGAGRAINNRGHITIANSSAVFNGKRMIDLNTLIPAGSGWTLQSGADINDLDQIVGTGTLNGGSSLHAYLYRSGQVIALGVVPGGMSSHPTAINDVGQVTGVSDIPMMRGAHGHAFLWAAGIMKDLGVLPGGFESRGWAINNLGQVVGQSEGNPGPTYATYFENHAILYSKGKMTDLNSVLPPNSGWTLVRGNGINDLGQIVGMGIGPAGRKRAFLLTPVWKVSDLIQLLRSLNPESGTQAWLASKLNEAQAAQAGGAACPVIDEFSRSVQTIPATQLSAARARYLIGAAKQVKSALSCH